MPKHSVGTAMKNRLAQAVTTLAGCWRIVRTDGQQFGFTTFDSDMVIEGVTYRSIDGFSATAIQSGATGQVDNLQVLGFFAQEGDTGGVLERDVKNRLFDYARIYLFFIDWQVPTIPPIRMRTGWLGETVVAPNGSFAAELRGLTQALVQELGNFYSPLCRNDLGDNHCKIPIMPGFWQANTFYNVGDYVRDQGQVVVTDDTYAQAIYQCTTAGQSAPTPPSWNPAVGATIPDYQVVWTSMLAYRQIGAVVTPMDQHNFVANALSYPAGLNIGFEASIAIINSVSVGSVIEVSDGINTVSMPASEDTRADRALYIIFQVLSASNLNMTYTPLLDPFGGFYGIKLTNHSGLKGSITKSGDILGAIIIENFGDQYLDAGTVTWLTGFNTGVSMELKHYEPTTNVVTLYLGMLMPINTGDRFWYHPGCDKRRDTCVRKFNNIINNRSEPDIPGVDKMLSYPDT